MSIPVARLVASLERTGVLVEVRGTLPEEAVDLNEDSRNVVPGSIFVAVRGAERDGHTYLADAAARGATAAIVEDVTLTTLPAIIVRESRMGAAVAAAAAFEEPSRLLRMVGVTGTNGKTTTVSLLRHLLDDADAPAASIGTLGVLVGAEARSLPGVSGLTTPGPVELQRSLRTLVGEGVRSVAMEVSSHSLHQRRVEGLRFDAAVFTNFTRDHLDYHGTMDGYFAAKARLMQHLADHGAAVVNLDDPAWASLPTWPRVVTYSANGPADVTAGDVRFGPRGSELTLRVDGEEHAVQLPLIGDFNVANALAAAAAAFAVGETPVRIAERLATIPQVPGRLEILHERPAILRDYAHTPDAIERALAAVRPFVPDKGSLVVVFGCGGDRDRGKRPEMGAIAERLADSVILTSDNPRMEDPERILDDIASGMRTAPTRIEDRRSAIQHAVRVAGPDDVILLAGKGHENYQIRGTERQHFDESEIVRDLTSQLHESAS